MQSGIEYVIDEGIDKFIRIKGFNNPARLTEALLIEIKTEALNELKEFLKIELEEIKRKEFLKEQEKLEKIKYEKTYQETDFSQMNSEKNPFEEQT